MKHSYRSVCIAYSGHKNGISFSSVLNKVKLSCHILGLILLQALFIKILIIMRLLNLIIQCGSHSFIYGFFVNAIKIDLLRFSSISLLLYIL